MDVAGLAIGIAGLAGLFSACIDSYHLIQRGVSFQKDYKILQTKFDNQELRLYAWGTACGLTGSVQDEFINTPEVCSRIVATLQCIKGLLDDQVEFRNKYGLKQTIAGVADAADTAGDRHLSLPPNESGNSSLSSSRHSLGTFFRRKKQQQSVGLIGAVRWAIEDYEKFSGLIQHLKDLNDDLESFTRLSNILGRQKLIVEYEVEEVEDLQILQEIELAGQDDADIVSEAASVRLAIIKEGSLRTLSMISSTEDTRRSSSFLTARSRLSFRDSMSFFTSSSRSLASDSVIFHTARSNSAVLERLSGEIARDPLLSDLINSKEQNLVSNESATNHKAEALDSDSDGQSFEKVQFKHPRRDQIPIFKVLAVGCRNSNTTILLETFSLGYWPENYQSIFFNDYVTECSVNRQRIKLLLMDAAGQQDYPALRRLTFTLTHTVALCFRADKPLSESIDELQEIWSAEVAALDCIKAVVLVGVHDPKCTETEAIGPNFEKQLRQEYARSIGAINYLWCSPRSGKGVDDVFITISLAVCRPSGLSQSSRPSRRAQLANLLRGLGPVAEEV